MLFYANLQVIYSAPRVSVWSCRHQLVLVLGRLCKLYHGTEMNQSSLNHFSNTAHRYDMLAISALTEQQYVKNKTIKPLSRTMPMCWCEDCHCSMCCKFHGAAFTIFGEVNAEDFRYQQACKAPERD